MQASCSLCSYTQRRTSGCSLSPMTEGSLACPRLTCDTYLVDLCHGLNSLSPPKPCKTHSKLIVNMAVLKQLGHGGGGPSPLITVFLLGTCQVSLSVAPSLSLHVCLPFHLPHHELKECKTLPEACQLWLPNSGNLNKPLFFINFFMYINFFINFPASCILL